MGLRSDLAMELTSGYNSDRLNEYITLTEISVDLELSKKIGKPIGDYVTIESRIAVDGLYPMFSRLSDAISNSLKKFTSSSKNVLVIGLGNPSLTADALGSKVLENIVVTRHLFDLKSNHSPLGSKKPDSSEREKNDGKVRISGFSPSVMGVTGIESYDIVSAIVEKVKPDLVIAVDSLASAAISRLACAFQICSSGITPGSGVSNHKRRLDKKSLGVDVVSIGVPMVVYADVIVAEAVRQFPKRQDVLAKLESDISSLIVTPKEIDILVSDCGKIIASAINSAFDLGSA